ncbi:MAG: hypothetical protein AB8B83_06730 [Bdellovibrionales bacterium]
MSFFTIFSKSAGHLLSQTSALLAAGHLEVAQPPPEAWRFRTVETIADLVYSDKPETSPVLINEN